MDKQVDQEFEFNILDYLQIFLNRKWMILLSFLLVFLCVFIYTRLQIPIYRSSALFRIETQIALPSEVVFPSPELFTKHELSDYVRQVVSRPILERAAEEMGWIKDDMSPKKKNWVVAQIESNVEAQELRKGNMIRLYAKSEDPQRAADIVNKTFEVFKKANVEQRNQQIRKVRVFVEETLGDVAAKLKEQEERLRELTTQGAVGVGSIIIENITKLEKKRSDLLTNFTEQHPDVLSIDEEITALKEKLKNLPKEEFEYRILERDIEINETLYNSLKQRLQEVQIKEVEEIDNVILVNPADPPTRPFYPNTRKNYFMGTVLGLALGITLAFMAEQLDTSIRRVDDIESFLKTSVLGVIPYCASIDSERSRARRKWKRIFFGRHTKRKEEPEQPTVYMLDEKTASHFLEAFRILSVNLQMRFGKEGGRVRNKIIMITSCGPRDGKSLIVATLAVIMSQMGYKVLLLDTDTRRPTVHRNFGLKRRKGGLTEVLIGEMGLDAATKTAADLMLAVSNVDKIMDKSWLNNLNIITAGSSFPNPANLFNSDKMNETLNYLKNKYDIVLVDSPPILTVSEPSIVAPKSDEILLVFRVGFTSRLILRRAKAQIESTKGKGSLSGVIVNNVTPETERYSYYGYEKYYGRYYREERRPRGMKREEGSEGV